MNSPDETVLPILTVGQKLCSLSPREFVTQLAPKLKDATHEDAKPVIEAFAGLFSGIPQFYDFQVQVPEWVKSASNKFWDYSGLDFNELINGDESQVTKMAGKLVGVMEIATGREIPSGLEILPEAQDAANHFTKYCRDEASKLPARDAGCFFTGMEKAKNVVHRMENPAKRIRVFMIMSMAWRHVGRADASKI